MLHFNKSAYLARLGTSSLLSQKHLIECTRVNTIFCFRKNILLQQVENRSYSLNIIIQINELLASLYLITPLHNLNTIPQKKKTKPYNY